MKMNENKYHILMFGGNIEPITLDLGSVKKDQCNEERLLVMIIDKDLNFKTHTIAENLRLFGTN